MHLPKNPHSQCHKHQFQKHSVQKQERIIRHFLYNHTCTQDDLKKMNHWHDDARAMYQRMRIYYMHDHQQMQYATQHYATDVAHDAHWYTYRCSKGKPYAPYQARTEHKFYDELYTHYLKTPHIAYIGFIKRISAQRPTIKSRTGIQPHHDQWVEYVHQRIMHILEQQTYQGKKLNHPKTFAQYVRAYQTNDVMLIATMQDKQLLYYTQQANPKNAYVPPTAEIETMTPDKTLIDFLLGYHGYQSYQNYQAQEDIQTYIQLVQACANEHKNNPYTTTIVSTTFHAHVIELLFHQNQHHTLPNDEVVRTLLTNDTPLLPYTPTDITYIMEKVTTPSNMYIKNPYMQHLNQ